MFELMKLHGTIRRSDLEGGHWTLETDDGKTYQLDGKLTHAKDGMHAHIEGKLEKDKMGIGMTGPHFTVEELHAVDHGHAPDRG